MIVHLARHSKLSVNRFHRSRLVFGQHLVYSKCKPFASTKVKCDGIFSRCFKSFEFLLFSVKFLFPLRAVVATCSFEYYYYFIKLFFGQHVGKNVKSRLRPKLGGCPIFDYRCTCNYCLIDVRLRCFILCKLMVMTMMMILRGVCGRTTVIKIKCME